MSSSTKNNILRFKLLIKQSKDVDLVVNISFFTVSERNSYIMQILSMPTKEEYPVNFQELPKMIVHQRRIPASQKVNRTISKVIPSDLAAAHRTVLNTTTCTRPFWNDQSLLERIRP